MALPYVKTFEQRRADQLEKRLQLLEKDKGKNDHDSAAVAEIKSAFSEMSQDIKELNDRLDNISGVLQTNKKNLTDYGKNTEY